MKRIATVALLCGDRLLIGKRSDDHRWNLPGGHCDSGETPEQAAARELKEETGITLPDCCSLSSLCPPKQVKTYTGKDMEIHCFFANVPTELPAHRVGTDPGEAHDWSWVNVANGLPPDISMNWHNKTDAALDALGIGINQNDSVEKSNTLVKAPVETPRETSKDLGEQGSYQLNTKYDRGVATNKLKNNLYHHVIVSNNQKQEYPSHVIHTISHSEDPTQPSLATIEGLDLGPKEGLEVARSYVDPSSAGKEYGKRAYEAAFAHHGRMQSDTMLSPHANAAWSHLASLPGVKADIRPLRQGEEPRHDDRHTVSLEDQEAFRERVMEKAELEKAWPREYNRVEGQQDSKGVASEKQKRFMHAVASGKVEGHAPSPEQAKTYIRSTGDKELPSEGTGGKRGEREREHAHKRKEKKEAKRKAAERKIAENEDKAKKSESEDIGGPKGGDYVKQYSNVPKRTLNVTRPVMPDSTKKAVLPTSEDSYDEHREGEHIKRRNRPKTVTFGDKIRAIKAKYADKKHKSFDDQVKEVKAKYKTPMTKARDMFYAKVEGCLEKGVNEELISNLMDLDVVSFERGDESSLDQLYKAADRLFDGVLTAEEQVVYELAYLAKCGDEDSLYNLIQFTDEMHSELLKSMTVEDAVIELFKAKTEENLSELIDEHKRLVHVLETPSHEDDEEEAKRQRKELEEYEDEQDEVAKSNYGPRGAGLYNPTDNINRKAKRTGVVHENVGQNKAEQRYTPSVQGTFAQQADRESKRDKAKSKKNPVKVYTKEEIAALSAEKEKAAKGEDEDTYHIHQDGHQITDKPLTLAQINATHGGIKRLEGAGFIVKPVERVSKSEDTSDHPPVPKVCDSCGKGVPKLKAHTVGHGMKLTWWDCPSCKTTGLAMPDDEVSKSEDNSRVVGKKNGYSVRRVHNYLRYTSGPKRGEYVHRHEAEKRLGRKLKSKEHVNHKSGNRRDNSAKNTKVMSASKHAAETNKKRAKNGGTTSGGRRIEHTRD